MFTGYSFVYSTIPGVFFQYRLQKSANRKFVDTKQAARNDRTARELRGGWRISKGGSGSFSGIHHIVISFLPLILKNTASAMIVENVRIAEMAEATPSLPRMICE